MMKKNTLTLLAALFIIQVFAQTKTNKPLIIEAAYYDKTPPLREMAIILPGERDRSWKNDIVENKSFDFGKSKIVKMPEDFVDPVLQSEYNASRGGDRGILVNIDGVPNANSVAPPDTDGDVGPNHYFQMINLSFAIWDKLGNKLYGPVDNSTLWQGFIGPWTGTNDGDPIVLYDEMADRWMASQFAVNTSNGTYWQLVAVSEGPDPLGAYHRYAFQFSAFNDYPKMGVWPDGYYATFNMFGNDIRAAVAAFERDSMLVGAPARMVYYDMWDNFSMLPADQDGTPPPAGAPCYFAHLDTWGSKDFEIYEFDVDWATPANSSIDLIHSIDVANFNSNLDGISQKGTSRELDGLTPMLMFRLQYRNFGTYETLITNHTVNAGGGRGGVRWYEFRKENGIWTVHQQSTYAPPDGENRWMASVAMGGNGTIAIACNISGPENYPSIIYTGRPADAPLGQMTYAEVMPAMGSTYQSSHSRWGDYSCLSVDPVDDTTFWYTGEWMGTSWTRITQFDFGPFLPPVVSAGIDTTICENRIFETEPNVLYTQSVFWESDGDGFFFNPDDVEAAYFRGEGDIENGQVNLWITAFGYNEGETDIDTLTLFIQKKAEVFVGADTLICHDEVLQLNAMVSNEDSLIWSTSGDGFFNDESIADAIYTPGPNDILNGSVWLTCNAYSANPCITEEDDKLKLSIDACTSVEELVQDVELQIIPNPTTGVFTFSINNIEEKKELTITLADLGGKILFTQQLNNLQGSGYKNQINLSYFPKGTYILSVKGVGINTNQKIILQ